MDHTEKEIRKKNPRDRANVFSLIFFTYMCGLLKRGYKKDLDYDDLYEVLQKCSSKRCGDKFERLWEEEKKKENPSLLKVMWKRWRAKYFIIGPLHFVYSSFSSIAKPYFLSNVVAYFVPGQTHTTRNQLYLYAIGMVSVHVFHYLYTHNFLMYIQGLGIEIKTSMSSLLYRKSLKLSPAAMSGVSMGNIVAIITRDLNAFVMMIFILNDTWVAISQILVVCYLLYLKVGYVSFIGIGIVMSTIPVQIYVGSWITKLRLQTGAKTDERLQLIQETLSTMRIIKMYTWEAFFTNKINEARKKEISKLLTGLYLRKMLIVIGSVFCNAGFYTLLLFCMWSGISSNTSIIFYIIANFNDLKHWIAIVLPNGMNAASVFVSAYKRVVIALSGEELEEDVLMINDEPTEKPFIEFLNVDVNIHNNQVLKDITFRITSGLTLVSGSVGSGKSSLFKAILRDYTVDKGSAITGGRISYASQDPWLFPSSIKQNILFGEAFDYNRYQEVVRVCALTFDFNLFERGDETILTDRGLNLSKGQQARINLARAVYRKSEIYILDDSLTALDAAVQDFIFKECIQTFLKNTICILISQTVNHIAEADNVIIMDKGKIKRIGSPDAAILNEVQKLVAEDDDLDKEVIKNEYKEVTEKTPLIESEQGAPKQHIYKEIKKEGSVDFRVYRKYCSYGGGVFFVLLNIFFRGGTSFTSNYLQKLLTTWVDKTQEVVFIENNITYFTNSSLYAAIDSEQYTFRVYTIILIISVFLEAFTTYLLIEFCKKSSINLHKAMTKNVISAVMSFFDTHLVGNILNRFSQDMNILDESLTMSLDQFIRFLFQISSVSIILIMIDIQFLFLIVVIVALLLFLRILYIPTGRSLKRLEAATRSPMVGHLSATLEGLTTIRSCKVQDTLIEEYDKHQDLYTSAHYLSICTARAFGFFADMMCSVIIMFVLVKFIFFYTDASAGIAGLAVTQVVILTAGITFCIRNLTEVENHLTSLERILEYTDIETETKDNGILVENWPTKGAISYQNVYLAYNNSENYVLKNLNFDINPKERIGIVGRTGAGKSSILTTLFRLYDVKGNIIVDGVNTKNLSLDFLRKHIAVIPQDPVLFSGTIRTNLDPLNEFTDNNIWDVIEKVGMKKHIFSLDEGITSFTLNFSSGQKQLICLARAILRKNQIVVMDEATANMDHETDAFLHDVIKQNFIDCTILTIAHRLRSVLECDKVMVLDKGEIKEYDSPRNLLQNKNGWFYKMVQQAGLLNYIS